MNSKQLIINLLEERRGQYVSGAQIARDLGVSRCAVWKTIVALREEGYQISAMTNRGYRLEGECDKISAEGILSCLPSELDFVRVETYPSLASTNLTAKERAECGENEWLVICAEEQSDGKGRMGRTFFSPSGSGLYMSILLRPKFSSELSTLITTAAAVSASQAIEEITGKAAGIKWVNDIFADGRKVCGILTEAKLSPETGVLDYAVLGIGVNVYSPNGGFPDEISSIATSLLNKREKDLRNSLCAAIIRNFHGFYTQLEKRSFIEEYKKRSIVIGKRVAILSLSGEEKEFGTVLDIDENCNLIIRGEDGTERTLSSGEIRIKLDK